METQNYIEIFQDEESGITLDVKLDGETVWLDQYQLETLFDTDRTSVGYCCFDNACARNS